MIDVHCHILPGLDDGPARLEQSIEMARIAASDGIRTIVATPHVGEMMLPPEAISASVLTLNEALAKQGMDINIIPGADVNIVLEQSLFRQYTIGSSSYVLVEFPHAHLPVNASDMIFRLCARGLRPIVTHPERNGTILKQPERIASLMDAGALIQVTAASLTGDFGPAVADCAMGMLRKGQVHFLATDAHSPTCRRPILSESVRLVGQVLGESKALELVVGNPGLVLRNEPILP